MLWSGTPDSAMQYRLELVGHLNKFVGGIDGQRPNLMDHSVFKHEVGISHSLSAKPFGDFAFGLAKSFRE